MTKEQVINNLKNNFKERDIQRIISAHNAQEASEIISSAGKEFAKLHVKAALEAAHKKHQLPIEDLEFTLSAYPETNIK